MAVPLFTPARGLKRKKREYQGVTQTVFIA